MKKIIITILLAIIIIGAVLYSLKNKDTAMETGDNMATSSIQTYHNEKYNFSFSHPGDFKIVFTEEPDTLLAGGEDPKQGFQIDIMPIDEDITALTVERIKQDIPDIVIESPQEVVLGSYGKGIAFLSHDESFGEGEDGKTREVWFVYDRTLYQIRSYASNDSLIQAMLGTWEFGK